jgi:hypothetical protein
MPRICFLRGIFPFLSWKNFSCRFNEGLGCEVTFYRVPFAEWKEASEDELDESENSEITSILPEDPAKVDFPFFSLRTRLEYSDLTLTSIKIQCNFLSRKIKNFCRYRLL